LLFQLTTTAQHDAPLGRIELAGARVSVTKRYTDSHYGGTFSPHTPHTPHTHTQTTKRHHSPNAVAASHHATDRTCIVVEDKQNEGKVFYLFPACDGGGTQTSEEEQIMDWMTAIDKCQAKAALASVNNH
jgi:hypothetical protein